MTHLPVIVGFGGISPAGRSSCGRGFNRLVLNKLAESEQRETLADLGILTGLLRFQDDQYVDSAGMAIDPLALRADLEARTLIRRIPSELFDADAVLMNRNALIEGSGDRLKFQMRLRNLPTQVPDSWEVKPLGAGRVEVSVDGSQEVFFPDTRKLPVQSAGTLPTGFEPGTLYQSRNHPRALQMAIYAASDALHSSGLDIDTLIQQLAPDQIGVFASNSIGQLDDLGFGGLSKYPPLGKRTTSKQMPLGYAQMPADFVNAYLLGNHGTTGGALGACATLLYNLRSGVEAIKSGRIELALVGGSDAPVIPEVIEGFRAMGALAEDKQLQALDGLKSIDQIDHRKACRPFGNNCGFTIGESAQFLVLMSDRLAIESGAQILGSVPEVFVHADGYKKSISAPGVGNYLTLGKAAALVKNLLGEEALQAHSFVQAHGTSTPQNRVTESHVLNEIATAFGIGAWPVSAVKAFVGHSQGTAAGDQIMSTLGVWSKGILPGLVTTEAIAEDVHRTHLSFSLDHTEVGTEQMQASLINAKGFGGNNASAVIISPAQTKELLSNRYDQKTWSDWQQKGSSVAEQIQTYDQNAQRGETQPIYRYDHNVLEGADLRIDESGVELPGQNHPVRFDTNHPFSDLIKK